MEGVGLTAGSFGGAFKGRRVLVTGHTGFKGSWLVTWLQALGAEVTGYALAPPTRPSCFELCELERIVESRIGDIRDFALLRRTFEEVEPEIVFHLAAQPLVRESYRSPRETFETNVGGTVNLLECVRLQPSVRSVVVVTSDKCYHNREWDFGYREIDPMGGRDPYSASKGCAELVTAAYRSSFFEEHGAGRRAGVASARAGNVIGGGDWGVDRLIPDCVRAMSEGRPVRLRSPDSVRPWQHVLEPLAGYLQLGAGLLDEPDRLGGAWNFGPAEPEMPTVREVAERFLAAMGRGRLEVTPAGEAGVYEARQLRLSCQKAVTRLRWRPLLTFAEALDWTAEWYAAWASAPAESRLALTRRQIDEYTDRAVTGHVAWAEQRRASLEERLPVPA